MRTLPDIRFVDINDDKFVSFLIYILLEDLKAYGQYLPGLLLATPEEEEASMFNEAAQKKQNLKRHLEDQADELLNQFDRDKQQRQIDKFRDDKMKLSPLTATKSIPLFNDDTNEYWQYLTCKFGNEDEGDGLLHFLVDIFENVESNTSFIMSKALIDVTVKIRNVLTSMSDCLHMIYDNNPDELPNVPSIIKQVDYTIQKIPTERSIKQRKMVSLEVEEESDDSEEKEESKNEVMINEQNSDVQKVLQMIRDHIIKGNLNIREAFELPDIFSDFYLEFHEFKTMIKTI